jgi:hypothetical protein
MKICDRCKSDKGVQTYRFGFGVVYITDGKEQFTMQPKMSADLCSLCVERINERELVRALYDILRPPEKT